MRPQCRISSLQGCEPDERRPRGRLFSCPKKRGQRARRFAEGQLRRPVNGSTISRSIRPCSGPSHWIERQTKPVSTSAKSRFSKLRSALVQTSVTSIPRWRSRELVGARDPSRPARRRNRAHERVGLARHRRQEVVAEPAGCGDLRAPQRQGLAQARGIGHEPAVLRGPEQIGRRLVLEQAGADRGGIGTRDRRARQGTLRAGRLRRAGERVDLVDRAGDDRVEALVRAGREHEERSESECLPHCQNDPQLRSSRLRSRSRTVG